MLGFKSSSMDYSDSDQEFARQFVKIAEFLFPKKLFNFFHLSGVKPSARISFHRASRTD
jgi:hypothetical protein